MPTKVPPQQKKTAEPVLENFYNLKQATVRLGLATEDPTDTRGQDWLRRGFNRPEDGSKGRKFPGLYMSQQLMFSDSDLAVIAEIARSEPRARTTRPSRGRRPRQTAAAAASS